MVTHLSAALMYTFFLVFLGEDTSHEELEISSDKGETGPRDEVEGFMIFDFKMLSTVFKLFVRGTLIATECQKAMTCFFRDQLFAYTCRVQPRSGCKTERLVKYPVIPAALQRRATVPCRGWMPTGISSNQTDSVGNFFSLR